MPNDEATYKNGAKIFFWWDTIINWSKKDDEAAKWPIKEDWSDIWENERPTVLGSNIKQAVEELIDMKKIESRKPKVK